MKTGEPWYLRSSMLVGPCGVLKYVNLHVHKISNNNNNNNNNIIITITIILLMFNATTNNKMCLLIKMTH